MIYIILAIIVGIIGIWVFLDERILGLTVMIVAVIFFTAGLDSISKAKEATEVCTCCETCELARK